jgi:hypothetical protein
MKIFNSWQGGSLVGFRPSNSLESPAARLLDRFLALAHVFRHERSPGMEAVEG